MKILQIILMVGIPLGLAIWAVNFIFNKIQKTFNLPVTVPMRHKMLFARNVVKIENPTLFKVSEKRRFSLMKLIPFLRHKIGNTREYYIKPSFVIPYDKTQLRYKKAQDKSKFFSEILLSDSYRVISKCTGIDTQVVDNAKVSVEVHTIYYMKKGKMEGLNDFIKEAVKRGLYEIEEPKGVFGIAGRDYYKLMQDFRGGK